MPSRRQNENDSEAMRQINTRELIHPRACIKDSQRSILKIVFVTLESIFDVILSMLCSCYLSV